VEVHRIDSEMSGLVEQPWLQLMCCTIYLPHGHNFRWREESPSRSEYVTNFIQLGSPQPVDRFLQTKLHWKAPKKGYLHICGMYKSDNK